MARKREVLPPTTPLLCDHITLQNKHCQSYGNLGEQATHEKINFFA